jgi:predicted MFS family arabinose efflux permease
VSEGVGPGGPRGLLGVLGVSEFRWLWLAAAGSVLGDQVARVALAVLVFDRTGSAGVTAGVYALTFLPALVGGVLLSPLADRWPRRRVVVLGDLLRAALLLAMTAPGLPLPALAALVVLVVLIGAPWGAAEAALLADVLSTRDYPSGVGLRAATLQAAQLAGFAVGGVLVARVGPRTALGVDAATFLASAALLRVGLRARAPARPRTPDDPHPRQHGWSVTRRVLAPPQIRSLLGFSWLLGLLVIPEGLAAPYAQQVGAGPQGVGVLLTAGPAGVLLGTVAFTRFTPGHRRAQLLGPLATAAGAPLVVCALHPGLVISAVLFAVSGMCTVYQVQVVTEFLTAIPEQVRGHGLGLASAGLLAAQGLGLLLGGLTAQLTTPTTAVAIAGAATISLGALLTHHRTLRQLGGKPHT